MAPPQHFTHMMTENVFYSDVLGRFPKLHWSLMSHNLTESLKENKKQTKKDMCTLRRKCKGLCFSLVSLGDADDGCGLGFRLCLSRGCKHQCLCCSMCRWQLHWPARLRASHVTATHFQLTWRWCIWDVCWHTQVFLPSHRCHFLSAGVPVSSPRIWEVTSFEWEWKDSFERRKYQHFYSGLHGSIQAIIYLK